MNITEQCSVNIINNIEIDELCHVHFELTQV